MKIKYHEILKTLTKIQFHHKPLSLTNINPLTNWQVSISLKLNLNINVNPYLQLCDSIPIFESKLTLASLPKLDLLPEPTLIPISIDLETEQLLLDSHISLMGIECEIKFFDLDS